MKLFSGVFFPPEQMNPIVSSELHDILTQMETLHLTSVKIDTPKMTEVCLFWKWNSIFKLAYLQTFLSDLSDWGVEIQVDE